MILASRKEPTKYCHVGQRAYRCRWKVSRKKAQALFSVRFLGLLLLNSICRPCHLFAKTAQGIPVFLCRVKLRAMLEWSSLYRVALLLSKINDDSDLDAEAAILYGKVGVRLFSKSSKRCEVRVSDALTIYGLRSSPILFLRRLWLQFEGPGLTLTGL